MNNLINISNLKKSYNHKYSINILTNINLIVNKSDIISIIGPSGSGKTTLLNIIGTLDNFDSGNYFFKKININSLKEKDKNQFRNKNIGFIHQFHHLIPELSTLENIIMPSLIGNNNYNDSTIKAKNLLDEFNLTNRMNLKSKFLSGGEKQRASIARAMINSPDLIIADEMTGNLDEKNSNDIFNFFIKTAIKKNQTVIYVTHNLKLANKAKKKYILEKGFLENIQTNAK